MKKQRNIDIQLLRGAAIIAVLGFHLRPEYVPQGFLGVDIFFAISGYLMTVILYDQPLTAKTCLVFYERRLKRLLPAYILCIFATFVISSFFVIKIYFEFLKIDTFWSMAFGTNFQSMFEKETYFKLINDYKFLLHTWSLSVEIQYYLLAPIILIPINWSSKPLMPLLALTGLSWIFQTFIPYPTISFGLVFSQIWQFLIGSIVFYISKKSSTIILEEEVQLLENSENINEEENLNNSVKKSSKMKYNILQFLNFILIFVICFMPKLSNNAIYESLMRLAATIFGGISIYLGTQTSSNENYLIFVKVGSYLGDISYSVYLFHWPIIILAKYLGTFEKYSVLEMLFPIFGISVVQYHLFEKLLLHQSSKITFSVCAFIYGLLIFALFQPQSFGYGNTSVCENPFLKNEKMISECKTDLLSTRYCNFDPELTQLIPNTGKDAFTCSYNGTGNATVFFTGNSYAFRQLAGVLKALEGKYKILYFDARPSCSAFETLDINYQLYHCDKVFNKNLKILKKFKPDIFIISERLNQNFHFKKPLNSSEAYLKDNTTIEVAKYFQSYSNFTKKIFFIEPNPLTSFNPALKFAKEVPDPKYNLELKKVRELVDPGWIRIKTAMKSCSNKCIPIHTRQSFIENGKYAIFDSKAKLSYFCDYNHLSNFGVERMIPTLKKSFDQALKELNL